MTSNHLDWAETRWRGFAVFDSDDGDFTCTFDEYWWAARAVDDWCFADNWQIDRLLILAAHGPGALPGACPRCGGTGRTET